MDKEAVQMFAAPIEGILKDFGDTGCADHEQSPTSGLTPQSTTRS
jgi:hypothetical protein